jgi:hypothetical protein
VPKLGSIESHIQSVSMDVEHLDDTTAIGTTTDTQHEQTINNINSPASLHPQGAPLQNSVRARRRAKHVVASPANDHDVNRAITPTPNPHSTQMKTIPYIPMAQHPAGVPFLGSVDVQRSKHVSEMLDFGKEEYGMIGEDTNLFPDESTPLTITEIFAAIKIDGTDSLQTAPRALVTEFADIFSNDVRKTPALVEPMKLAVNAEKWADSKN